MALNKLNELFSEIRTQVVDCLSISETSKITNHAHILESFRLLCFLSILLLGVLGVLGVTPAIPSVALEQTTDCNL